jgi:ubiquinone/menaquinone biosynthesis C-methylase UbiE
MGKPMNYDDFASAYARTRSALSRILEPLQEEVSLLPVGSSVLDIGCGTGNYIIELENHFPKNKYFGFDRSDEMLNIARSRDNKIQFITGNADEHFPYPDSMFELEFMINVAHHLLDLNRCFKEISRTLKPKGILIMTADSEENIRERTAVKLFPGVLEIELERYLSEENATGFAENYGLELIYSRSQKDSYEITDEVVQNIEQRPASSFRLIIDSEFKQGIERLREAQKNGEKWYTNYLIQKYEKI